MEFALHVEELILNFCIKIRNRWERPDPSKKPSDLRNVYLCIISPFKSTKEEDDSIDNSQEEVSRKAMQKLICLGVVTYCYLKCRYCFTQWNLHVIKDTLTIVPYQEPVNFQKL